MTPLVTLGRRTWSPKLALYILGDILPSFLIGTVVFLLIMLMFQVIRLSEFVVVHQVSIFDIGRLCVYLMLSFVPIAVPIAFLFSVLMGVSRANSDGEILALQSTGFSASQIFAPLGAFSVVVTGVCLYTSLYTVPQGNRSFELLFTKLANERVMAALKPGVFIEGFYGLVIYAEHVVPVKNELQRVFIYDDREEKHPLIVTAENGILRHSPERGLVTLRLNKGAINIDRGESQGIQQKIEFDLYDINLNVAESGHGWREYSPPSYNYTQLKTRLEETRPDPPAHRQLLVELHRRFSLSFACMVFATLGFFIGVLSFRGIRSSAVVLCLLVAVIYWTSYITANAMALSGAVAPWLGIWLPNLIFLLVSVFCYRKRFSG